REAAYLELLRGMVSLLQLGELRRCCVRRSRYACGVMEAKGGRRAARPRVWCGPTKTRGRYFAVFYLTAISRSGAYSFVGWTSRSTSTRLVWSDAGAWKMLRSLPPYGRLPLRCLQFRRVDAAEYVHAFGVVRHRRVEGASQSSTLRPSPAPVLTVS